MELTKSQIQEKLKQAIDYEHLVSKEIAGAFNFSPIYISMMRNEQQWNKCPAHAWDKVGEWLTTGLTLKCYIEQNGKSRNEKPKESRPSATAGNFKKAPEVKTEIIPDVKVQIPHPSENPELLNRPQKLKIELEIRLFINDKRVCFQ